MSPTRWALQRPAAVLVVTAAVVLLGVLALVRLKVNLLPDITYPLIKVYVRWPGATPDQIEENIARIVERPMASLDGLDYLQGSYTDGMYTLFAYFQDDVNRDVAYQDVLAKMQLVRQKLPIDIVEPQILKADPSQLPVMDLAISSTSMTPVQLRTWAEQELQDRFIALDGTAGADVAGGLEREIQVQLNAQRMQALQLPLSELRRRLQDENVDVAGGLVTVGPREFSVRTRARYQTPAQIGQLLLRPTTDGRGIRLADVATVSDRWQRQRVITRFSGEEVVRLSIFKQVAANTVEVADRVRQTMATLKPELPEGTTINVIYDQSRYIEASVNGVRDAALIAAILVVLATTVFLSGWRRVVTVVLTLPVTLLGTFLVMEAAGYSINIFSLGGLVIAIGLVLDDCVVVIENITRHQHEGAASEVMFAAATEEVAGAVVGSSLTFLALFLPFLLVPGLVSLLFHELIVTVATAIAFSFVVALTLTPVLMRLLFRAVPSGTSVSNGDRRSEYLLARVQDAYEVVLDRVLAHRWATLIGTAVLLGAGLLLIKQLGSEFLPEMDDGLVTIKVRMPTGASVEETAHVTEQVASYCRELSGVEGVYSLVGGRVVGLVTTGYSNEGEANLQLVPRHARGMSTKRFVAWLTPLIQQNIKAPGARLKVMHTKMKGIRSMGDFDVEVEIYGPANDSVAALSQVAQGIAKEVRTVPGLTALDVSIDVAKPSYDVIVDHDRASAQGISGAQLAAALRTFVDGDVPSQFESDGYYYPIRILVPEIDLADRAALERLPLLTTSTGTVLLGSVARIVSTVSPTQIDRKDQRRVVKVTGMAVGRSVGQVTGEARRRVAALQLPSGYTIKYGGQAEAMRQTYLELAIILLLAMFLAYVVLVVEFSTLSLPLMIVLRVPMSIIGMAIALYAAHTAIGITVLIGIIIMAGNEINHGVVLLEFVRQKRAEGASHEVALRSACRTRLRPILMTLLVGVLGLLPLALGVGDGTEVLQPMAIAVTGGLIFSLPLTLLVLPAAYLLVYRDEKEPAPSQMR